MSNPQNNGQPKLGDLVIVGSSAGGVEALSILVSGLKPDFPAPIVLAQHLDPSRPSNLGSILRQKTVLEVVVIGDRTKLEPGKVYVVPSNQHVKVDDGHIELVKEKDGRPRPSVNLLLKTAAATYEERLIAVVLTGAGSDGADGALAVKNAGGLVIVQNPSTARYASMPAAVSPVALDFQLNIEQIAPFLYDLLTKVELPPVTDKPDNVLQHIFDLVNRQANIDFRLYKSSTILRRIGRRMAVTRKRTMGEYAEHLERFPVEVGELVKAFLINVTQFFRDPAAFNFVKSDILPALIEQARARDRSLRFWSAGCATGEEPYSLAMLLADMLGSELAEWTIKIFATDLDEAAIDFARRGMYSESMVKNVPEVYQDRYFEYVDQEYRISKTLRQMVIFGNQDLSHNAPFPRIDLVMCRNLLIYFTPELQDYVINHFAFSLRNTNGYLFLGKAETIRPSHAYYELINKQWKIYRCNNNTASIVPRQNNEDTPVYAQTRQLGIRPTAILPGVKNLTLQETDNDLLSNELNQLRRFNETLLRFLPVGVAVIDRSYRLITANGAARRLLSLHDVNTEQDFLHAVRGIPYTDVRAAIDTVFRERRSLSLPEIELSQAVGGNGRFVSLSIVMMQFEANLPDLAVISITDVTEQVQIRQGLETAQQEQAQLLQELSTANRRLNDLNKELLDANEEMQVANEELVLTHEELQATIEEFETTNEELQATNEELETNNEELQATNEELQTTNDELRARSAEIQEISSLLTDEQGRLNQVIEQAPFYTMFLRGPSLLVEAFNPRYARLVENRRVQSRPLEEVYGVFFPDSEAQILELAYEVFREDQTITIVGPRPHASTEATPDPQNTLTYTLKPSHNFNGAVDGVIIYAVETKD